MSVSYILTLEFIYFVFTKVNLLLYKVPKNYKFIIIMIWIKRSRNFTYFYCVMRQHNLKMFFFWESNLSKGEIEGYNCTFCIFCILSFQTLFRVWTPRLRFIIVISSESFHRRGLMTHCAVVVHDGNRPGDLEACCRGQWYPRRRITGDTLALHALRDSWEIVLTSFFLSYFNSELINLYYYIKHL